MSIPNKDELRGKLRRAKGVAQEKVGRAVNDPELESEGVDERARGRAQETIGKAKRKVGDAIQDLGRKIRK